jgi:hypothetical protein
MKIFSFVVLFFSIFFSTAQDSYEFESTLPPDAKVVEVIDIRYVGQYKNEKTGTIFQFDLEGIKMISTIYSFISRDQIRESSKYQVRNGYLFGVVQNDSIPCYLEDDKYYFGIKRTEVLVGKGSENKLTKIDDRHYVINFKEENGYTPSLLTLKSNKILIQHFTYPSQTVIFDTIKSRKTKESKNNKTHILTPTSKEWKELNKDLIFDDAMVYELVK